MNLSIEVVEEADWGDGGATNVEAIARLVAESFDAFDSDENVSILLSNRPGVPPRTLSTPNQLGQIVVFLNTQGTRWAQLAYQFAHEYCHVIADPTSWPPTDGPLGWVEECLCEAASQVALRTVWNRWLAEPPVEGQEEYAYDVLAYERNHTGRYAYLALKGVTFSEWLVAQLPGFATGDHGLLRDEYVAVGDQLGPLFEADPTTWRVMRSLHFAFLTGPSDLKELMGNWSAVCSESHRGLVHAIAARLAGL